MFDAKKPFQAMLHDGTFTNPDFQPARDVVALAGRADMAKIRTQYYQQLVASGMPESEATTRTGYVKGCIALLTEQYLVMGMARGVLLTDKEQLKRAWELIAKAGNAFGQRVGNGKEQRDRDQRRATYRANAAPLVRTPGCVPGSYAPRVAQVAALADRIGEQIDKNRKSG